MSPLLFILALQVTVSPSAPAVGDPVRIALLEEGRIVAVAPGSSCAELVEQTDRLLIVRSFSTGPCTVGFMLDGSPEITHRVTWEVRSVLGEDETEPSPYRPPLPVPLDRRAWWSVGVSAFLALAAWALVFLLPSPSGASDEQAVFAGPPLEELLSALVKLEGRAGTREQIAAADAVRRYLHRTDSRLTEDRTTGEILRELGRRRDPRQAPLRELLRTGDRAKFAPSDAAGDAPVIHRALESFLAFERGSGERG